MEIYQHLSGSQPDIPYLAYMLMNHAFEYRKCFVNVHFGDVVRLKQCFSVNFCIFACAQSKNVSV